jgi:phosphatidylinositol-3,4,5-trisphosphate 3-phosphatase and dual-specificity protein phosphatase PTEN
MKKKVRSSIYGLFNFDDNDAIGTDDSNTDKNNANGNKKKISWLQGEYDQLTNRLMDFIVPRAIEEGAEALEFADVEMQKNPMYNNSSTTEDSPPPMNRKISIQETRATLITIGQKIFSGKDVVDALIRGIEANSREDAIVLGEKLLTLGYLEEEKSSNNSNSTNGKKNVGKVGSEVNSMDADNNDVREMKKIVFKEDCMYKYALNDPRVTAIIYSQLHTTKGHAADNLVRHFRQMVSLKKIRFIRDGFDLDLTYITRKVIAMGFPSSALEGMYRNPMDEVQRFFKSYHQHHFKIYNLCSERQYDPESFNGAVAHWPFDDHNPCPLTMIKPFCQSIEQYLKADDRNTVAVHCKAGKGRTGLMVCAYLLHTGAAKTADEATRLFARRRTHNEKGVTIPSQIRYINYYERIVRNLAPPIDTEIEWLLSQVAFDPIPIGGCTPSFTVAVNGETVFKSTNHMKTTTYSNNSSVLKNSNSFRHYSKGKRKTYNTGRSRSESSDDSRVLWKHLEVFNIRFGKEDDIRFRFKDAAGLGTKTKLFHCWLNSRFIVDFEGDGVMQKIVLSKNELDDAIKDKKSNIFPDDFKLTLQFRKVNRQEIVGEGGLRRKSSFRLAGIGDAVKKKNGKVDDDVFVFNSVQSLKNVSSVLCQRVKKIKDNEKESTQVLQPDGKMYEEVSSEVDSLKLQVEDLDACIENVKKIRDELNSRLIKMQDELDDMPIDEVML